MCYFKITDFHYKKSKKLKFLKILTLSLPETTQRSLPSSEIEKKREENESLKLSPGLFVWQKLNKILYNTIKNSKITEDTAKQIPISLKP